MTLLSIWGVNPAGYLAGLGLLIICPGASLSWRTRDQYAETALTPSQIRAALLGDVRDCDVSAVMARTWLEVADAIARCRPDTGDTGSYDTVRGSGAPAERARRKRELAAWSAAMAKPRCGLDLTSGQQDFATIGRTLAASMTADDVAELIATEPIPLEALGRQLAGVALRLNPSDTTPYAYRARSPATDPPPVRVAQSWLAWRAISAHPLLGSRYATAPHVVAHADRALCWSLGHGIAVDADGRQMRSSTGGRRYTYRSRISVDQYGYGSLSPAEFVPA